MTSTPRSDDRRPGARPIIALTLGDPAGIGPEIATAALRDERVREDMQLLAIGPARLRPAEVEVFAAADQRESGGFEAADRAHAWLEMPDEPHWELGRVQASAGRHALRALRAGHELAIARQVAALVTGPVSKEALHLAGEKVEGQTELLARWCGVERYEMVAVAGKLRVMLATRHMPLRRALDEITTERVFDRLTLLDRALRDLGIGDPSLALAGMNPHAGENGLLGSEEDEVLRPAIALARESGVHVAGPISPDSVFEQASRGAFDGVLALYHDQAFIPIKLLARDGGVTVIAGLPYLRVSPVHGTAFDIAGRGLASAAPLVHALRQAAEWARLAARRAH
jgi:4-hydroxythreonine-4-phosphate dehydrogenase